MRNYIVTIICFLLLVPAASNAQDLRLGIRGGLNLATFVGEDADDANLKVGFHVGPFVRYGINDNIYFQPELLLSSKGFSEKGSVRYFFNTYDYKFKQNVLYLDVPLMAGYNIVESFSVQAGLQPSFMLAAKYKLNYEENPDLDDEKDDNANNFAGVDLGLVLGLQFQSESGLDAGFRFTYGLPNVFDDEDPEAHNLNLMFTVGYSIGR